MNNYLNTWLSSIPANQAKLVEVELRDRQKQGQLSNKDDFNKALNKILTDLKGKFGKPLLTSIPVLNREISNTELHNTQLSRTLSDLVSIYNEINQIVNVNDSHFAQLGTDTIPTLEAIVKQLENQIDTYEILTGNTQGVSQVIYDDFKNLTMSQIRDSNNTSLFYDHSTLENLSKEYDCTINQQTGLLTLPIDKDNSKNYQILEVEIEDNLSSNGDLFIASGSPDNILSGVPWLYDLYYFLPQKEAPTISLVFNLPGVVLVNYVGLEPSSNTSLQIEGIYYKDATGNIIEANVAETTLLNIDISNPVAFTFSEVFASAIVVKLIQPNYILSSVNTYTGQGSFIIKKTNLDIVNTFTPQNSQASNFLDVAQDITPQLPPVPQISTGDLPVAPNLNYSMVKYSFGLSEVSISNHKYLETGIYVSQPKRVPLVTSLSLSTKEILPIQEVSALGKESYIEYYVYKKDYSEDDTLINTEYFPILPNNTTSIGVERIFPNSSGICSLRFKAIYPGDESHNISIFRNGIPLTEDEDWSLQSTSTDGITKIRLFNIPGIAQGLTDIFTVSYTPAFLYAQTVFGEWLFDSDGDLYKFYIDPEHTLWYRQDGIVETTPYGTNFTASYSDVTIIILIRTTIHNAKKTAMLDNYKLFLGGNSV